MGGRSGRTVFATVAMLTLLLSSAGVPGAALAADVCAEDGVPPGPPYIGPAIVVEFQWDAEDDMSFYYGVTTAADPTGDPDAGDVAFRGGGCDRPVEPLLITKRVWYPDEQAAGLGTYSSCQTRGWASAEEPGTYTITVESWEVCKGFTDHRDPETWTTTRKQPETAKVTAIVDYYPAGALTPYDSMALAADVRLFNWWSSENAKNGIGKYEKPPPVALGTVTLPAPGAASVDLTALVTPAVGGPATGGPAAATDASAGAEEESIELRVQDVLTLLVAVLRALDEAEARGDGDIKELEAAVYAVGFLLQLFRDEEGHFGSSSAGDVAAVPPARPDEPPEGRLQRKAGPYQWVYVTESVRLKDLPLGEDTLKRMRPGRWYQGYPLKKIDGSWVIRDENGEEFLGFTSPIDVKRVWPQKPDSESTSEAGHSEPADDPDGSTSGSEAATILDTDTTTAAPAPGPPPPEMKGWAKKQQRVWVSLPAEAVINQVYPTVEKRKLKTGTWYQMKVNGDGSRDFYNKKGKWIGTNPWNDRDKVVVRVRGKKPDE